MPASNDPLDHRATRSAPCWHLVAGSTGAGKTTYARTLAERIGGVCFSMDEWMQTLFWPDLPEKNDYSWALERVRRCETQAAAVALQLAARGVPAIMDFGLTTQAQRATWVERAAAAGILLELHALDLPSGVRWNRVQARNAGGAGTFVFPVTRAMFDSMELLWETPSAKETALYAHVHRITEAAEGAMQTG